MEFLNRRLKHPNIRQVLDVNYSYGKLEVAFEFMDTDLAAYIREEPSKLTMGNVKLILYQLLSGISAMHQEGIMHRDIKPANVFISGVIAPLVKVGDLGHATRLRQTACVNSLCVGSLLYKAPELLLGLQTYGTPVDVWSAGCVFAEMVLRDRPLFLARNELQVLHQILAFLDIDLEAYANHPLFAHLAPALKAAVLCSEKVAAHAK
ncbi:MAG: hypothetical protein KVP17_003303 [Porospora cf. gigantea B]|uniref:uncharacterized protein n=1 Tax=Porospora cf. gigantea B TaxID=2853592 RepID=UPI003571A1A1|nr:MAG: hypothetical protein KVP17_003303 [Porospora cf. gigantea B]